jgi:hypothetical protein
VLCKFRIEQLDISDMTVGKMDTKTAPNIGIKNYKILPSPREKSNT